jgi:predicted metal-binding membrane protein
MSVSRVGPASLGRVGPMSVPRPWPLAVLIAGAWLVVVAAQLSGTAGLLHHHALIDGRVLLPPVLAVAVFLLGWQVMLVAMMLPASLPRIRLVGPNQLAFLAPFALVWTIFGLWALSGDVVLHHEVHALPWLAARLWLIEGGILALAGVYQLLPLKQRFLAECRHPAEPARTAPARAALARTAPSTRGALALGLDHGLACLGSSWALMLLMFAEGFASLGWMALLTVLMAYEARGRHGPAVAVASGVALLVLAAFRLGAGLGTGAA